MFGFRKRNKKMHSHHHHHHGNHKTGHGHGKRYRHCIPLSDAFENQKYIIRFNPDKQTIEMGLSSGSMVYVHRNDPNDTKMIVGLGETRLIIPRISAESIKVK